MLKNKWLAEGPKCFYKNGKLTTHDYLYGDDLQAMCTRLDDETNKNLPAYDFIVTSIENDRHCKIEIL